MGNGVDAHFWHWGASYSTATRNAAAVRPGFPTQSRHLDSFASQLSRPLGPTRLIRRFPAASALAQRRSLENIANPAFDCAIITAQSSAFQLGRICHLPEKVLPSFIAPWQNSSRRFAHSGSWCRTGHSLEVSLRKRYDPLTRRKYWQVLRSVFAPWPSRDSSLL